MTEDCLCRNFHWARASYAAPRALPLISGLHKSANPVGNSDPCLVGHTASTPEALQSVLSGSRKPHTGSNILCDGSYGTGTRSVSA